MTIDQLRYFVELARYQHVGKAAQAAHISPSALSTAVSTLERELGCPLFLREGRNVRIAEEGRRFMEECMLLLAQFDKLPSTVKGLKTGLSGSPRLGASHFLASRILTPIWSELQEKHSELHGEISSLPTFAVLADVVSGALDLGLVFSPFRHPDLDQTVLHQGQLVLATRKNHPLLRTKKMRHLKELSKYPAVLHKGRPGVDLCETHPIFETMGIVPRLNLAFDNDDCAIQKIIRSDAWTMIPEIIVKMEKTHLAAIPLPKGWNAPYTVAIVTKRGRSSSTAIMELCTQLKEHLKDPKINST